jgi:PAS domain S-box-containing protein
LSVYRELDAVPGPFMHYISAWDEKTGAIWYEFAGTGFADIFETDTEGLPDVFRRAVVDQRVYKYFDVTITKQIIRKADMTLIRDSQRRQGKTAGSIEAVYKIRTVSGRTLWLKDSARIESFEDDGICLSFGNLVDVSKEMELEEELARTKAALEDSEKRYRLLFEESGEALFLLDGEGIVRMLNRRAHELAGSGDIAGKSIDSVFSFETAINSGGLFFLKPSESFETVIKKRDGSEVPVEIGVTDVECIGERFYQLVIRDISLRRALENEKVKSGKLEVANTIAAGISHDFNNILSIIVGNTSLAQMELDRSSRVQHMLGQIEKAANMGKSITHKFINFSQSKKVYRQNIPIAPVVNDAVMLTAGKTSGVRIHTEIPKNLPDVRIDHDSIRQALSGIISNAIEAAQVSDCTVVIEAERVLMDADSIQPGFLMPPGDYVRITVSDRGPGISREDMPRIFDPYFSTRERGVRKGMGLGLTIAYSAVKQNDGHIHILSEEGRGTKVMVYLPVAGRTQGINIWKL